jgi:hypothetical protein
MRTQGPGPRSLRRARSVPRRYLCLAACVALGAFAAPVLLGAPPAGAATVTVPDGASPTVVSADALIESVGVNVHTYYTDTSYADTARVVSLLQGLGVRHVRDGLVADRPDEVAALQQLGSAGVRSTLIVGGTSSTGPQSVDPGQLSELSTLAPTVDAVEPTNEYDCSGDPAWAAHQHDYATALVQALQARPELQQLGVFAAAFCQPESVAQYGTVTGTASVTNAHDYSGGQPPELALESRLPAFGQVQQPDLPMVVTETGYQNALDATPTQNAVTEASAADYTVRALLDAARLGVARTYLYELLDEKPDPGLTNPEQHFGLVRADGTVKPAYTAVQALLSDIALGSPWAVTAPSGAAAIPLTLRGGGGLLRSLAVTDPNGGGETLALWLATPLENTTTHQRLTDTARAVRVQLPALYAASAQQPSRGNAATSLGVGSAFTVPVGGAVTLVHLTPSAGPATAPACTPAPGYLALAQSFGAKTASDLDPATGWAGSPGQPSSLPDGLGTGAQVSADSQQRHVAVPSAPKTWTVTVWERTDPGSASYATFLHATGAPGALLRTYDMTDDVPSHMQLSGYGLPPAGAGFGTETWGQALPGTWHLLSLSVSSTGTAVLAVDGIVQGSVAGATGALTGVDVGSVTAGFRGALGGLEVFAKALSPEQLAQLATTSAASCALT